MELFAAPRPAILLHEFNIHYFLPTTPASEAANGEANDTTRRPASGAGGGSTLEKQYRPSGMPRARYWPQRTALTLHERPLGGEASASLPRWQCGLLGNLNAAPHLAQAFQHDSSSSTTHPPEPASSSSRSACPLFLGPAAVPIGVRSCRIRTARTVKQHCTTSPPSLPACPGDVPGRAGAGAEHEAREKKAVC